MWRLLLFALMAAADDPAADKDGESSRKVLGSSVVTSVSVIMDAGNGSKIYADAIGRPVSRPQVVASPIDLLNPDRYEFYTFDDSGDLVKRLMTLEEIRDIIATGDDDAFSLDTLNSNSFIPEKRVNDVVSNVQNVLKEEIKQHKNPERPTLDTPDVSDSWSMILPAIFGNSGEDIKPEGAIEHITPDTIMVEPTIEVAMEQISTTEKVMTLQTKKTTPRTTTTTTEKAPMINVEIFVNSNSTTEKTMASEEAPVVEIKPLNDLEMTKDNMRPVSQVYKGTKRPPTFRPTKKPSTPRTTTTTSTTTTPTTTTTTPPTTSATPPTTSATPPTTSATPPTTSATPPTTSTTTTTETATTIKLVPIQDTIGQSSTTLFEKLAPPQTSTTETPTTLLLTTEAATTTESPVTTTSTQLPEISTTELPTTPYSLTEDTKLTTIMRVEPDATPEITSTFGPLSTFFIISDNRATPDSTKQTDDLSTQSTEYSFNNLPKNDGSTTESQSTDRVSTIDQLLLTSTNIYEINSELADLQSTTDSDESTTSTDDKTEKTFIRLTNPTESPATTTTDQSFIDTIEQLISQAVGTVAPPAEADKEAAMVEEMMMGSGNKTMEEVLAQTATVASGLMAVGEETTTVGTTGTTVDDVDLLSDSVGSLLSQVYGLGSTTLDDGTTSTTPEGTTVVPTTTEAPGTTTGTTTTTQAFVPHIINITIIRNENRTKPAKADTSLEQEYDQLYNEMKKNATVADQEILKADATGSVQDTTEVPDSTTEVVTTPEPKPSIVITINENKTGDSTWTLVSTIAPPDIKHQEVSSDDASPSSDDATPVDDSGVDLVPKPLQGFGLEDSTAKLDTDIYQFVQLCNELAFGFWKSVTSGVSSARSVVLSPFAATSLLAMVFLGARGATSGEMNEILKLDDMVTFNPHLIFKNVSESIEASDDSGVAVSAIVRELYSDRSKGKLLGFYKERVRQFYDGHVEEASFRDIGDTIRRRTNLLVKKSTDGKITEFLKDASLVPKPPLAGISVSIFQTDCSQASVEGRDGELHFVVLPAIRQRRLVPIPAVVYRSGFLAGYEPSLDATAAALGTKDQSVSTVFVIPGQQGVAAPGDGLARLEKRLVESSIKKGAWSRLLRSLIPRPGLELQLPRFEHRSLINATHSLKRMGLHELFDAHKADLKGLNGAAHELHLSDVLQINEFATCGERRIGEAHHREAYPAVEGRSRLLQWGEWEEPRDYQRAFHDPLHDPALMELPLALRPRQARLPEAPRLRFDRPFLYVVRHNPSGLILHMGRFNPRLLP